MNITKYQHACFVLEKNGEHLIIDPGKWTSDFVMPNNVVGVIITHQHDDHMDNDLIAKIAEQNPDAIFAGHAEVVSQLPSVKTKSYQPGDDIAAFESFGVEFFGGEHARIAPDLPTIANLGVMIDEYIYYPGDSFVSPGRPVAVLALPVSAPWMKYSEAMEFLEEVSPQKIFPTHDAILSDVGKELADRMATMGAEKTGALYERLPFGESIKI